MFNFLALLDIRVFGRLYLWLLIGLALFLQPGCFCLALNYLWAVVCIILLYSWLLIVQLAIVYLLLQLLYVFNTDVYNSRVCINVH